MTNIKYWTGMIRCEDILRSAQYMKQWRYHGCPFLMIMSRAYMFVTNEMYFLNVLFYNNSLFQTVEIRSLNENTAFMEVKNV